ncbi:MAG TPA: SusC/RagA family TonB-linked outer membrane protein [Gemmatimonadaceae bacterium]|nr:SusC/RagA family TonB-linked outer membrane protein [Gemmatimonadaceae bacterium]
MSIVAFATRRVAARIAVLAVLLCIGATARAQTGRITGMVADSTAGHAVGGVSISIVGTTLGVLSADDGHYAITGVPPGTYVVEARRLGYAPVRRSDVLVTAGQTTTLNLKVQAAALHLQETVITGVVDPTAGTKIPFTVGRVTKEDAPVPPTNAMAAIQGKIAGVAIVPPAQPGDGISIQLRTPSSINKSNSPLFVVDGVILSDITASSADLNSLDIESVEVVKGAAGASLYGSRAANGVVQIRTSRGAGLALGQTQFTFRSEMGGSSMSRDVRRAKYHFYQTNANGEYVNAAGAVVTRDLRVPDSVFKRFQDNPYTTPIYNPVAEIFHPGDLMTNSLNIAQNGEKTNFLTTVSRQRQDGVLRDHGAYDRTDFRINLDHRPRDDVQFSVSGYHSRSNREELDGNLFFDLTATAPDVNLLQPDPDGTKYIFQPDPQGVHPSPLYLAETQKNFTHRIRTLGSTDLRYTPRPWLSADANASYDRWDQNQSFFLDRGLKSENQAAGDPGSLTLNDDYTSALNASGSLSLLKDFNKITARTTARMLIERQTTQSASATGTNFAVGGVPRIDAALTRGSSSSSSDIRAEGYFFTGGLDYDSRFIFDGLVRRDASSLFGPGEQWHTYYRASGAYRLAQESWWPWHRMNEFKLRASQGTAGTRPSFADQYETYTISSNGTLAKAALGNRFLKPETAKETEFGLDAIFDNRYSLQLSRVAERTTDELVQIPLPGAVGFTSQWQNAGTVVGNSLEGTLEAQMFRRGTTSWKLGVTADRSRHHISEFNRSCIRTATISYRCVGEDLSTMYGNAFVHSLTQLPTVQQSTQGVFEVNDDGLLVAVGQGSHYTQRASCGVAHNTECWGTTVVSNGVTYQWGMPIVRLDSTGQQAVIRIGSGNPRFHYGVSNNLTWHGFQFYGLLDTQVGGNIYNQNNQRSYQYNRSSDVDQAGKPDSLKKTVDYYALVYNGNAIEDWFVEPGGFVKLRELSVRYQIPSRFMNRIPGNRGAGASVSLVGRNLKTWTRYKGYDPEVGTVTNRLDSYDYPQYRNFTAVFQLQF